MKRIRFTTDTLALFADYIRQVIAHKLNEGSSTFNSLLQFHLQQIAHKLHRKTIDLLYNDRKLIPVQFTLPEVLTLSYAFKHVQIHPYLMGIEGLLIEGL